MMTNPSMARRLAAAAMLAGFCLSGPAWADGTDNARTQAAHTAYRDAMKCFIAIGMITGHRRDAGDKAQEAAYKAKARAAFNIAVNLGEKLGYSQTRIDQDFGLAQTEELPKLVKDRDYFNRTVAVCKTLGLI